MSSALEYLVAALAGGAKSAYGEWQNQQDKKEREAERQRLLERETADRARQMRLDTQGAQRWTVEQTQRNAADMPLSPDEQAAYAGLGLNVRRAPGPVVEDPTATPTLQGTTAPPTTPFAKLTNPFARSDAGTGAPSPFDTLRMDGTASAAPKQPYTVLPFTVPGMSQPDVAMRPLNTQESLQEATRSRLEQMLADTNDPQMRQALEVSLAQMGGARVPTLPKADKQVVPDEHSDTGFSLVTSQNGQELSRTPAPAPAGYRNPPLRLTATEMAAAKSLGLPTNDPEVWTPAQSKQFYDLVRPPKPAAGGKTDTPYSEAYLTRLSENPGLMNNLTPSERVKLYPIFAERGYPGLGRQLQPTMIGRISETESAVASLKDLKESIKAAESKIGPMAGWSRRNPMDEQARTVFAEINLVKQRVGKALEGGVLRKEDEEKYKQILAVMEDRPQVAYGKIDGLVKTLERDNNIYQDNLIATGWAVPKKVGTSTADELERYVKPDGSVGYRKKGGK